MRDVGEEGEKLMSGGGRRYKRYIRRNDGCGRRRGRGRDNWGRKEK